MKAFLILEDGTVFSGTSIGSAKDMISEIVFNTSMTGYRKLRSLYQNPCGRMGACAKRKCAARDCARRKNVPRHILYFFHNSSGYMAGKQQAEDRDKEDNYGLLYRCKAK